MEQDKRKRLRKSVHKRVSTKIAKLRREGKSEKQAAAIAFSMARRGKLGPHGGYHR